MLSQGINVDGNDEAFVKERTAINVEDSVQASFTVKND
jgi:hypothetical protein